MGTHERPHRPGDLGRHRPLEPPEATEREQERLEDDITRRQEELDHVNRRLAELEQRLDLSERLLAPRGASQRLRSARRRALAALFPLPLSQLPVPA